MNRCLVWPAILACAACAPPSLRSAHSLDKGAVDGGFSTFGQVSAMQADLVTPDDEVHEQGSHFSPPSGGTQIFGELRVGMGRGWEIGVNALPVVNSLDVKWSILDERRHDVPVSIAIDLEGGVDMVSIFLLRFGVYASRTLHLSQRAAIRPMANLLIGTGGFHYRLDLPDQGTLDVISNGLGLHTPVGFEVPIRVGNNIAVAPYLGYIPWFPIFAEQSMLDDCDGCTVGLVTADVTHGAFAIIGIRFQPWIPASTP